MKKQEVKVKPIKKNVIELAKELPKGKFGGLMSILEPREIPNLKANA